MKRRKAQVVDHAPLGFQAWARQTEGMAHAHRHSDLELNYVQRGRMSYLIGGRIVTLPVGRLCVLWGSLPHQSTELPDTPALIWVTAPLSWVLSLDLPEPLIERLLTEGLAVDAVERPTDEPVLQQWITDLNPRETEPHHTKERNTEGSDARHTRQAGHARSSDPEAYRAMRLELEARLRRLALDIAEPQANDMTLSDPPARSLDGGTLAAVQAMAGYMNQHYQAPLTVERIAEAAHLHPHYAMTVFRQHLGLTLNQYLTRQRIAHAQRLLVTSDLSILEVGLHSGFGSNSRFHEAFKQATGTSPGNFRRQTGQRT